MSKPDIDIDAIFRATETLLGTKISSPTIQSVADVFHAPATGKLKPLELSPAEYAALRARQDMANSAYDF